jgi:hypothetical protein
VTRRVVLAGGVAAAFLLVLVIVTGTGGAWAAAVPAALVAAAIVTRWPPAERAVARGRAVLLLLLLPTLVHFHAAGGRINGDGVSYYVYVRSLAKDRDLDFTNEYAHYGLLERPDIAVPTRTGLRRSIFAVGPALVWLPFFAAGEGVARVASLARDVDLSGYGPYHVNAVALGSLLLGFAAVMLMHDVVARHFAAGVALVTTVAIWLATFLYWYMVQQPTMSHAPSVLGAAVVVWLWDRRRGERTPAGFAVLGLVVGVAMCLRWQNAVLGLLPAYDLLRALVRRSDPGRAIASGAALAAGALLGAFPQMAAWHVLYAQWVLLDPPHGADFLRLSRPFVLETLFSSRHGLLSWTPVLWLGYLGLAPLFRSRRALALPLLVPAAAMTYVNMCSGDWWAGGSFGNRRFDSLLPLLALGMAASVEWMAALIARRPAAVGMTLALAAGVVNVALVEGMRGRTGPVTFPDAVGSGARFVADSAGSPPTWPASWIFAWRHRLPPGQYDLLVGRYLFYRQNNMQGRVEIGSARDAGMLGEGWGETAERDGADARPLTGPARLLAPLDVPEDIAVVVRAACDTPTRVALAVNGHDAGSFDCTAGWTDHALDTPAGAWRNDLNDVTLAADAQGAWIDSVDFLRAQAGEGQERGFQAR